jgi:hypothetical protein
MPKTLNNKAALVQMTFLVDHPLVEGLISFTVSSFVDRRSGVFSAMVTESSAVFGVCAQERCR